MRINQIAIILLLFIYSKTNAQKYSDVESNYQDKTVCTSFGIWGNSGLGPGVPLFVGIEKWFPFSSRVAGGVAQDLAVMRKNQGELIYILSTSKINLHVQPYSTFDLYAGPAFNYLLINRGNGPENIDQYIGYQVGLRYFVYALGVFVEWGKGNYVHGGISISL